jgi:hypothetical protein
MVASACCLSCHKCRDTRSKSSDRNRLSSRFQCTYFCGSFFCYCFSIKKIYLP